MIKNEKDTRNWFVNVPSINTQYRNYNNNVWSSAILLRRTAINEISNITIIIKAEAIKILFSVLRHINTNNTDNLSIFNDKKSSF